MVRTISRACGSHVQEAEQVPLPLCPPMRYSDAMAHELRERQGRKINTRQCNVCHYKDQEFSFHLDVDFHTVIICQHVTPIDIDPTTSVANASLW